VTAIQRAESTNVAPSAAKSIKVDLSSVAALTSAFANIDVVVSAVPNPRLATEKLWMQAAVAAGVKRIIPSEFSTNLEAEASKSLPIVTEKLEIRKYVEELVKDGKLEWSSINNGPFFVSYLWLSGFMGPNPKTKTATYHDGGEAFVTGSTLERIGEGLAKSLLSENAEKTKNKPVYVYSAAMSEKKMTEIVSKITGLEFNIHNDTLKAAMERGHEGVKEGNFQKTMSFYVPFCFGSEYGGDFRKQAMNEELGLKPLSDAEVEGMVKEWLSAST
jgi:putative NADH-flavin reductase